MAMVTSQVLNLAVAAKAFQVAEGVDHHFLCGIFRFPARCAAW